MSLDLILAEIEQSGGVLKLEGEEQIRIALPPNVAHFAPLLRDRKPELLQILRQRGGRIASFPSCPACGSFALFRQHPGEPFECLSCAAQEISEIEARRAGSGRTVAANLEGRPQ